MSADRYHPGTVPEGAVETPVAFPQRLSQAEVGRDIERAFCRSTRPQHIGTVIQRGPRAEARR